MTIHDSTVGTERIPRELPEHAAEEIRDHQALTLQQRAKILEAVCAAAVDIHQARLKMGMLPAEPDPWPDSTLELFRRHAPNGRISAAS